MECVHIAAGNHFVLGIVSLRQEDTSASAGQCPLAALTDWERFLLGPGFIERESSACGKGLILAS